MSRLYVTLKDARCKANSTISGEVELRGDDDINVLSIAISMIGRCKTKIVRAGGDDTETLRGRAPLVTERRVLFNGPSTLHPGHSWNFEFTLPSRSIEHSQDRFDTTSGSMVGLFNYDINQDLPPCFSDEHGRAIAFVSYVLVANLVIDRHWPLSSKDIPTTKTLDFVTTRSVQSPDSRMSSFSRKFDCSSLALNPGHEDVKLTFKERLQSIYKSKLPTARFTLLLRFPSVAIVNQIIPLSLSIDHNFENSTAVAPPMVYLRKILVELVALTDTQYCVTQVSSYTLRIAPNWGKESWQTRYPVGSFENTKKGDPNQAGAPPVTEHLDLRDLMELRLPRGQAPTFKTFNIRRTYKISIKLTIECAQQQFKAEYLTSSLILLPGTYEPAPTNELDQNVRDELQAGKALHLPETSNDDNEYSIPPAYESVEPRIMPSTQENHGKS